MKLGLLLVVAGVGCGGALEPIPPVLEDAGTDAAPPVVDASPVGDAGAADVCIPVPKSQACAGASCGSAPNGCGELWNCGTCPVCNPASLTQCDPTLAPGCSVQTVEGTPMCCCEASP